MTTRLRFGKIWFAGMVGVGLLACSGRPVDGPIPSVYVGHGSSPFPAESLTSWVSYAEQVSEVSVLSETEIPPPEAVLERREGYIGRKINVRIVETLWTSPGATDATGDLQIVVAGWLLKGDKRIPFGMVKSPRLEVGGKYIMPLVRVPRAVEPSERRTSRRNATPPVPVQMLWAPLATSAVFAVAGDSIAEADVAARGNSQLARGLSANPRALLKELLAEARPDRRAMKYWHLPPIERIRAVGAEEPPPE
jgi:hypothetical protein